MGELDVLSVGQGHLRVTVDDKDPEGIDKARRMIEDMLKRGFSIFVETDKGLRRVKKFNPQRMTYLVDDVPDEGELEKTRPTKLTKTPKKEIPVSKAKSTAVGRTAGG